MGAKNKKYFFTVDLDEIASADTKADWINQAVLRYKLALQKRLDELSEYKDICSGLSIRRSRRANGTYAIYSYDVALQEKKYLNADNKDLIDILTKKMYSGQVCPKLQKNITACDAFLKAHTDFEERVLLESYDEQFHESISDIAMSNSQIKKAWECQAYPSKNEQYQENLIHQTLKGDLVRSKSEATISDALWDYNIPQLYEFPISNTSKGTVFYPDFTVLHMKTHKVFFWEHCGKMDNPKYAEGFVRKIAEYAEMGILPGKNLILTFETETQVITRKTIIETIRQYLL